MMSCLVGGSFALVDEANAIILQTKDGKRVDVQVAGTLGGRVLAPAELGTVTALGALVNRGGVLFGVDGSGKKWRIAPGVVGAPAVPLLIPVQ